MKKRLLLSLLILPLLSGFFVAPASVSADYCAYKSTQARVQKDIKDPWKSEVSITKGQSFNVGGFHDGTGQFGNDVVIQVAGPNLINFYSNGQAVYPPSAGEYTVYVNTRNQSGSGCREQAKVKVTEVASCRYGSTQARVQKNIREPWAQYVSTTKQEGFNVGSFHDSTGQFAKDTKIQIYGGGFNGTLSSNGAVVLTQQSGWYRVHVSTNNQSGAGCEQDAWVWVR